MRPTAASAGWIRHGILVAGVAVGELAGVEVEQAGEHGDEQHLRVVARDFGVGRGHQRAHVRRGGAQRRALVERLAHGHEDARRQALARDVADEEEQPPRVEQEEVVEVAADFARRQHRRREVDATLAGQRLGARQHCHLDAARRVELAGDACRVLALALHHALQRVAVPGRLGERQHEHRAERECQSDGRRGRVDEQPIQAKGRVPGRDREEQAGQCNACRVARLPQRGCPHEQRAQQRESRRLGEGHPPGTVEQRAFVQVLDQLGVDFAARHALADRRGVVVAQPDAGDRDQHELLRKLLRIGAALRARRRPRRSGPDGAARSTGARAHRPRWRRTRCRSRRRGSSSPRRRGAAQARPPRRGTSRSPVRRSACRRRRRPSGCGGSRPPAGSAEMSPQPEAAALISSMLTSAPAKRSTSRSATGIGTCRVLHDERRGPQRHARWARACRRPRARSASRPARARALRRASAARRVRLARAGGRVPASRSNRSGDSGSGSGIKMSIPTTAGCIAATRATSSARVERGHGQRPSAARLFASISTIVAGIAPTTRGAIRW